MCIVLVEKGVGVEISYIDFSNLFEDLLEFNFYGIVLILVDCEFVFYKLYIIMEYFDECFFYLLFMLVYLVLCG